MNSFATRTRIKVEPCGVATLVTHDGEQDMVLKSGAENERVGIVDLHAVEPRNLCGDGGPEYHIFCP